MSGTSRLAILERSKGELLSRVGYDSAWLACHCCKRSRVIASLLTSARRIVVTAEGLRPGADTPTQCPQLAVTRYERAWETADMAARIRDT